MSMPMHTSQEGVKLAGRGTVRMKCSDAALSRIPPPHLLKQEQLQLAATRLQVETGRDRGHEKTPGRDRASTRNTKFQTFLDGECRLLSSVQHKNLDPTSFVPRNMTQTQNGHVLVTVRPARLQEQKGFFHCSNKPRVSVVPRVYRHTNSQAKSPDASAPSRKALQRARLGELSLRFGRANV